MELEQIAEYLETEDVGVRGQTIFINFIPDKCPVGILLRDYFGGTQINHELVGQFKASYFLIVRAKSYDDGNELMTAALEALWLKERATIGTMALSYMRPRATPFVYAPSPGQLIEFSVVIDCHYSLV